MRYTTKIKIKTLDFSDYLVIYNGIEISYIDNHSVIWNDNEIGELLNDIQFYRLQIGKSCFIVEIKKLESFLRIR